jgi:uncharacterized protein
VTDLADLLPPAQEAELTKRLAALESRTTDQLVVVTVPSLNGASIADFGRRLGNHWGIGRGDIHNGTLIIVAPAEREARIEVGVGLEELLTDARAAEIMRRDMVPAFREAKWVQGIGAGVSRIEELLQSRPERPLR